MPYGPVSICILVYNAPGHVQHCLETLQQTAGHEFEIVVVDNGSDRPTQRLLDAAMAEGKMQKLIRLPKNEFYAAYNHIHGQLRKDSAYTILLNSDVEIRHPHWALRMMEWCEGVPPGARKGPLAHDPLPGPRDVVSCGWNSPPPRPDGWCILWRTAVLRKYPFDVAVRRYGCLEKSAAAAMRDGHRIGLLGGGASLDSYLWHFGHGSWPTYPKLPTACPASDEVTGWFRGLQTELLNFRLDGPTGREGDFIPGSEITY